MRTTVTLDPETERLLRKAMQTRGQTFKQVLNQAVRRGLAGVEVREAEAAYEVRARPMGLKPGIDPARLNAMADELEMDAHLELARRPPAKARRK